MHAVIGAVFRRVTGDVPILVSMRVTRRVGRRLLPEASMCHISLHGAQPSSCGGMIWGMIVALHEHACVMERGSGRNMNYQFGPYSPHSV